jgi:ABC-2 type transport system ATP-binding protein
VIGRGAAADATARTDAAAAIAEPRDELAGAGARGGRDDELRFAPGPDGEALGSALAIRNATKRWRRRQTPVLDGVELSLERGSIAWVGGINGAGKTTMLRIAAGLIDPDEGSVEAIGLTPLRHRARYQQLVSFLPAGDRGLYARLTVRKQLEFCARIAMLPRERFRRAVEGALDAFALHELADQRVDRISMGQRQRLRIAMTFLPRPEVVLLDEPLTSLDGDGAELLRKAIDGLLARGGAVLWCSPSGERLDMRFDARWVLEGGRLAGA